MTELHEALLPLLNRFSGQAGVALYRFRDGLSYHYRAEAVMPAASLIKLPILVAALQQVALGRLQLEGRYPLRQADKVSGNGVLQYLSPGLSPTLADLLTLMIIVSDNTATNLVIDAVGEEAINRCCAALGLGGTALVGKLQLPPARQNERQRRGERNHTCAQDMLTLLVRLERGELLPPPQRALALSILKRQLYTEALARYLPTDLELTPDGVSVASKSGCLRGVWHDAGLVYAADGRPLYALVVMTEQSRDRSFGWEHEGMMLIAAVSREVYALLH
jgi:beta-lactamase class A